MPKIMYDRKFAQRLKLLEDVQSLINQGLTLSAAAKRVGVSRTTVYKAQRDLLAQRELIAERELLRLSAAKRMAYIQGENISDSLLD